MRRRSMAKRRMLLRVRLPAYRAPRNDWRRKIHAAVAEVCDGKSIHYVEGDELEVQIRIYMDGAALRMHDVDNRLKDVLDALQGRAGGPKALRRLRAFIPNDAQVYRVVIEKAAPPGQSHGLGHLVVRRRSGKASSA